MKQFTRCTNCRQWYLHTATALVEIYQSDARRWTTVWCRQCMADAEQRSQSLHSAMSGAADALSIGQSTNSLARGEGERSIEPGANLPQLMAEHLCLMDRALHEDETILVPLIEEFMQRCRLSQETAKDHEHTQRFASYLQYWESFLKALSQ